MTEKEFWQWFNEKTKEHGTLVTPATAAKMIGVKRQYIERIVAAGRLTKHYYGELVFIGMNEINAEISRRAKKIEERNKDPKIAEEKAKQEKIIEEIKRIRRNPPQDPNEELARLKAKTEWLEEQLKQEKKEAFSSNYQDEPPTDLSAFDALAEDIAEQEDEP